MGKKRKFSRFVKWIRSDLPEEKTSVLLLGVTKIPSPTFQRRNRPHTLHFDYPISRSPTLESDFAEKCLVDNNYDNYNIPENNSKATNIVTKIQKKVVFRKNSRNNLDQSSRKKRHSDFYIQKTAPNGDFEYNKKFVELPIGFCNNYVHETNDQITAGTQNNFNQSDFEIFVGEKNDFNTNLIVRNIELDKTSCSDEAIFDIKTPPPLLLDSDSDRDSLSCPELGSCDLNRSLIIPPSNNPHSDSKDTMDRSVDSIGSCSLDVDVSTDFSGSSVGSLSDCTLRSVSILTPNSTKGPLNLADRLSPRLFDDSRNSSEPTIRITPDADLNSGGTTKKPSYLNLACCVNGYGNLTTYDSKLRENYRSGLSRSREVSPIRPISSNASAENYVLQSKAGEKRIYLTPDPYKPGRRIISPITRMAERKGVSPSSNGTNGSSNLFSKTITTRSFMSTESKNFASSMLYSDSKDMTDGCKVRSPQKFITSNSHNSSFSSKTIKSYEVFHHQSSKISSETKHTVSETTLTSEGRTNGSTSPKSFIQQRVERLYGPGALAQGFFITKQKTSGQKIENGDKEDTTGKQTLVNIVETDEIIGESNLKNSCSSPSLPVLRHLRPEFRAQLPILSPKKINTENTIQKSTTVPISYKDSASINGYDSSRNRKASQNGMDNKGLLNGVDSTNHIVPKETKGVIDLRQILNDEHKSKKPEISNSEEKENRPVGARQISLDSLTEHLPAAPKVILPVTTEQVIEDCKKLKEVAEEKDGHYFLKILRNETSRLIKLAEGAERELEDNKSTLSEENLGYLRSASGKARLLATQKMQQFEGLCHKYINQVPGEQFPTTAEDLQGFWDMVMLQVTQVNDIFKDIEVRKANNWAEIKPEQPTTVNTNKARVKPVGAPAPTKTAKGEAQRKQRELARKQMLEQRRKAMAEMRKQQDDSKQVEIFVPDTSSS